MDPDTQNLILNIVIIAMFFLLIRYLPRLTAGVPFVEPKILKDAMDGGEDVVVLDVRTPGEFTGNLGHVPGAVNILPPELQANLSKAGGDMEALKGEPVFVMCRTENRAPRTARILKKAGFTNVSIVKGGMSRWNRENYPVEGKS